VQKEIEICPGKEHQAGKKILRPARLDDTTRLAGPAAPRGPRPAGAGADEDQPEM